MSAGSFHKAVDWEQAPPLRDALSEPLDPEAGLTFGTARSATERSEGV